MSKSDVSVCDFHKNFTQQIQTWVVFYSFLVCSLWVIFRTKPENAVLENIVVQSLEGTTIGSCHLLVWECCAVIQAGV